MTIYHLAETHDWDAALDAGEYGVSTRGARIADVGYLHACLGADQLAGVIARFYADVPGDLCVLALDEDRLTQTGHVVRLEPADPNDPASERFPHVYGGPIPLAAVRDVLAGPRAHDLVAAVRTHGVTGQDTAEEWWDVLDADGQVTGDRFRRGDGRWPQGRFHLEVGICAIRPDGTVLVSQRSATKDWTLDWEFVSGSAMFGETSAQAAVRELGEEVGLVAREDEVEYVGRLVEEDALFDFFTVRVPQDAEVSIDPVEVATTRWVDLAEVERMWAAGDFALPWTPRLEEWLPALRRATDTGT